MNEASQRPRIKKNMVAVLVAASIVYPSQTSAGIPVVDFSQIAQIVKQTAQQARQFAQQMQAFTNGIKNEIMLAGNEMQANINRTMMEISKVTESANDLFNKQTIKELTPETDAACLVETVAETLRGADCFIENEVSVKVEDTVSKRIPVAGKAYDLTTGGLETPVNYKQSVYQEMTQMDTSTDGKRLYARADIFNNDVLSDDEADALTLQIKILQGPPQEAFNNRDFTTAAYKQEFVDRTRKELLKLYAINSLEQQRAIRVKGAGSSNESVLQSLQHFVDETIGSEEWIKKITNTHSDVKQLKTTDQVIRQIATIEAYKTKLSLMNYKQMERIERLMSIQNLNSSR